AFDVFGQGDDGAFGINFLHGTGNDGAAIILGNVVGEGIIFQLLDAERNALALRVDGQDDGLDLVALLVLAYGLFTRFVPGDVGQVNQTIDAAFQANEDAEVGDGLDLAGDLRALCVLATKCIPGVFLALLDTQGDAATFFVDVQNHDFHFVAHVHNLGRVD